MTNGRERLLTARYVTLYKNGEEVQRWRIPGEEIPPSANVGFAGTGSYFSALPPDPLGSCQLKQAPADLLLAPLVRKARDAAYAAAIAKGRSTQSAAAAAATAKAAIINKHTMRESLIMAETVSEAVSLGYPPSISEYAGRKTGELLDADFSPLATIIGGLATAEALSNGFSICAANAAAIAAATTVDDMRLTVDTVLSSEDAALLARGQRPQMLFEQASAAGRAAATAAAADALDRGCRCDQLTGLYVGGVPRALKSKDGMFKGIENFAKGVEKRVEAATVATANRVDAATRESLGKTSAKEIARQTQNLDIAKAKEAAAMRRRQEEIAASQQAAEAQQQAAEAQQQEEERAARAATRQRARERAQAAIAPEIVLAAKAAAMAVKERADPGRSRMTTTSTVAVTRQPQVKASQAPQVKDSQAPQVKDSQAHDIFQEARDAYEVRVLDVHDAALRQWQLAADDHGDAEMKTYLETAFDPTKLASLYKARVDDEIDPGEESTLHLEAAAQAIVEEAVMQERILAHKQQQQAVLAEQRTQQNKSCLIM